MARYRCSELASLQAKYDIDLFSSKNTLCLVKKIHTVDLGHNVIILFYYK